MQTIQAGDTTRVTLLTRSGALAVEFTPALQPKQYAELFEIVQEFDSEAVATALVMDAAKRWESEVSF